MSLALVPPLLCSFLLTPPATTAPIGRRILASSTRSYAATTPLRSSHMRVRMLAEEDDGDEEKQGQSLTLRRQLRGIALAAAWTGAVITPSGSAIAVPAMPPPAVEPPPMIRTVDASRMMGTPRPGPVAVRLPTKGAKASKKRGSKSFGDGTAHGSSSGGLHRNGVAPLPPRVEDVAKPSGARRISDGACMMDKTAHSTIMRMIQEAESESKTEIIVVTLPSIGRQNPRTFAKQLFNHWEIGGRRLEDSSGVLVLVVKDARRIEIKTGDHVKRTFSTSWTERMLEESVLPKFKRGRYSEGLVTCVKHCAMRLTRPNAPPDLTELGTNVGSLGIVATMQAISSWVDRRYRRKCEHCGYRNQGEAPKWNIVQSATRESSGLKKCTLHCSKCGQISNKRAIIPRISDSSDSDSGGGGDGGGGGGSW
jgi:uncharacterized protein